MSHLPIQPLAGQPADLDAVLHRVGSAQFVLLGEASHGTHEFYQCRADITKRLIAEHGFRGVAVEADWPDAYRVNRYVQGTSHDHSALESLSNFQRFPRWMWRNTPVLQFVEWLRAFNDAQGEPRTRAGFYGLDLYSMQASMAHVIQYLDSVDSDAAARARERYACFDHFGQDPQRYGYATSLGSMPACEREALAQLMDLRRMPPGSEHFSAEQNARLVSNAEHYYRMMFTEGAHSWNFRDQHMAETLQELSDYMQESHGEQPRLVVWAHNSHLGDARATDMARRGELNLGQMVREEHGANAVLVGFTTYSGTVRAAHNWDAPGEVQTVRPALRDSYEALMHEQPVQNFYLEMNRQHAAVAALMTPRLERAIGVIYRPDTERYSHYFHATLPEQFDALFHFDVTSAVQELPG